MRSRLLHLVALLAVSAAAFGQSTTPDPLPPIKPLSSNTYPEIVRIHYLEGDVRVSRGSAGWEQAVVDLPLESGFSLATGTGRAELEFENASTIYLGENSALSLDDLHTTIAVPHTEVTLLAGTLTVHLHPASAGESFLIRTPTDSVTVAYPEKLFARIDSYLDAIAITPQQDEGFSVSGTVPATITAGVTGYYDAGLPIPAPAAAADSATLAAWDNWVASRIADRDAALASVAAASGLPGNIPGLADLDGQGVFFACAPYGMCWEPPSDDEDGPDGDATAPPTPTSPDFKLRLAPSAVTVNAGTTTKTSFSSIPLLGFTDPIHIETALPNGITCTKSCTGKLAAGQLYILYFAVDPKVTPGRYPVTITATSGALTHTITFNLYVVADEAEALPFLPAAPPYFPCFPGGVRPALLTGHIIGRGVALHFRYGAGTRSYAWAVCHTGTWIYRSHMYVWVVRKGMEKRRHHHDPCRWIKGKKHTGWVPLHPRDLPGQPPVNRRHDAYTLGDKDGHTLERTAFDLNDKLEYPTEPPREFRKPERLPLKPVGDPILVARRFKGSADEIHLALDKNSHQFQLTHEITENGKTRTVTQPVASHHVDLRVHDNTVQVRPIPTHTGVTTHPASGTRTSSGRPHATGAPHTTAAPHTASHASTPSHSASHTGASHH